MIELISLSFGNLRSFVDDQHIVFQGRQKLVQVDGRNENTGGSSGAGKTTILMALDYLLGIGDVPSTVLQSRLTKDGIWASGELVIDGVPVSISRSKKDGLTIKTPDETISGNVKLAEEKIASLIGLPIKIFKKMVHKKQKEGGFFLNMTPKENYEFLISVLGLEKYIADIDTIAQNNSESLSKINTLLQTIELRKSSIIDMDRILSEKKSPESPVSDQEIGDLTARVTFIRTEIYSIKQGVKDQVSLIPVPVVNEANTSEINVKIAALVPARTELKDKLDKIDLSKTKLEADLNKIPFFTQEAIKTGEKIAKLKEEKAHIESSQCPTCLQKWVGDSAQEKVSAINAEIDSLIGKALALKAQIDEKPKIQENLTRLLQIRNDINDQMSALQDQRAVLDNEKYRLMELVSNQNQENKNEYSKKITEIENNSRIIIDDLNTQLNSVEMQLSAANSKKSSYLTAIDQYTKEVISLTELIAKKTQEMEQASLELESLKKQILIADEAKRLIKAYVLQTFQETLDAIGETATNILAAIPNMATSTVYFEGCKETKTGSIKDEIVAILNSDGNNDIPIKSLSGGERTAIDLAVDLAVIDVIETKASKGANFLFMDEPFDGLDSVCKENCLEILKQIDTNKKIIMVDHSSELKEMVSDVIMVVKKGETSTIAS